MMLPLPSRTLVPAVLTATQAPLPVSAPWPQLAEPCAATRRPKTVPEASGDCEASAIGPVPWNGMAGTNL